MRWGDCKHKWDQARERETSVTAWMHKLTMKKPCMKRSRCHRGEATWAQTHRRTSRLNFLHTRKTFSHWLISHTKYKEVAQMLIQYPRETKSISSVKLWQLRLTSACPISSFPNKGRKWLHPRISLWAHESVLWNLHSWKWVSILHVSCHRGKNDMINSNTTSPYWDTNLWAFPPFSKNKWMNDWNSVPTNFFFPSFVS